VGVVDFDGLSVVVVVDDGALSAEVFDRERVVVVVADDLGRVVVVVVAADLERVVVVVVAADLERVVVVVVADLERVVVVVAFELAVVDVVDAAAGAGALPSSLPGASSMAWVGPEPGVARVAGSPGTGVVGGGMRSSRRAYCMIRANTGAATWPP